MKSTYVLISPARNEEAHIEKTIQSVITQTILPQKWVIVSDGSTDRTDEIVKSYAKGRDWIDFIQMPDHSERNFAAKVQSFNCGYERVKSLSYDVIGSLDADISFEEDYFEYLLDKFERMPELGVAGTDYIEGTFHSFKDSYINVHHVNGQCQMFRRQCFEDIGGYKPIKGGGIDWVAVTTARMKGWKTYSFPDRVYIHHRRMGTANGNIFKSRFHYGKKDYFCGGHPLWQIFRCAFQMAKKPYIVGGLLLLLGYFGAWMSGVERQVSQELMKFHRQEQMQRFKNLFNNRFKLNR
jgi:glycosyltransferase involved in cell wall biosynthesis